MLPADWRRQMIEMIRGAAPLSGAWFEPGPWLDADAQIGVYREQFRMRTSDALDGELPGLRALMGEELDALYEDFLADHPPDSWSLDHLAGPFAAWLEARGADACQVDMARLDAAVMTAFSAREPKALDLSALNADTALILSPGVRLLDLRWSVHRARMSIDWGQLQVEPEPGDYPVAIYRAGLEVRHWELSPLARALLRAFSDPRPLQDGLMLALTEAPAAPTALQRALHEISARRLLEPISVAGDLG